MRSNFNVFAVCAALCATPALGAEKVNLTCVWTFYAHNTETFVIDLKSKKVLWVEEETEHEITKLSDGFIKFSGIKSEMKGDAGFALSNAKINFKINRINGDFHVVSDVVSTDRIGNCKLGYLF
jgi:hypothetical protein